MRKIDFQDGGHGGHRGNTIGTILAIFDLQVTPMLPSKFGVKWPFDSGEEAKNRFSRVLIRFSAGLARCPSFLPHVTQFQTT